MTRERHVSSRRQTTLEQGGRVITIGVDAHKRVHVALAVDESGREVGSWRGPNSAAGWSSFLDWATGLGEGRRTGVEGAGGYGRGLTQFLVGHGEVVCEVNARWTALGRRSARKPDKSDRHDARAVALFVQREGEALPAIAEDDETTALDLLSTQREAALAEATRLRNQLHALLLQLDPEYQLRFRELKSHRALQALRAYPAPDDRLVTTERTAAVRRLAERLELALAQAEECAARIRELAAAGYSPLTELCGVNLLTAGTLAGILGPGRRFTDDAALAAYAGAAPLEASSAGLTRHRLNRGGNRRLNAILYRIAITQAHHSEQARAYLARRVSEGKTKREAIRALKRYLVRAISRLWARCLPTGGERAEPMVA